MKDLSCAISAQVVWALIEDELTVTIFEKPYGTLVPCPIEQTEVVACQCGEERLKRFTIFGITNTYLDYGK